MTIFDILKDILQVKSGILHTSDEFEKTFDVFIINRYLSMRDNLLPYTAIINRMNNNLSKENIYLYLVKSIPYQRNSFIQYIKKDKIKNEKTK